MPSVGGYVAPADGSTSEAQALRCSLWNAFRDCKQSGVQRSLSLLGDAKWLLYAIEGKIVLQEMVVLKDNLCQIL